MDSPSPGSPQPESTGSQHGFLLYANASLLSQCPSPVLLTSLLSHDPLTHPWGPCSPSAFSAVRTRFRKSTISGSRPHSRVRRERGKLGATRSPRQGQSRGIPGGGISNWGLACWSRKERVGEAEAWIICSGFICSFGRNKTETWGIGVRRWTLDSKITKQGLVSKECEFHQAGDFWQWRLRRSTSDVHLHTHFYHVVGARTEDREAHKLPHLPQGAPEVCGHQIDKPTCLLRLI